MVATEGLSRLSLGFDHHTRNGGKRWCLMYAGGPQGRACGTIAKVRRYRERNRGRRRAAG